MIALRLLSVGALVFLAVGCAFLTRIRVTAEWPEWLLYAFAISYSWILGLSILLPSLGWTVDHAAVLTVVVALTVPPWRELSERIRRFRPSLNRPSLTGLCLAAAMLVFAVAAWFIEPSFTGEESLDLAPISRFADGGPIQFDNTSILPHTRAFYLVQPYQLAVGMTARWSHVGAIVTYLKIRPLLVLLSLMFVYAVLRRMLPTRTHALSAFAVVLVFVGLDITTWESNSLFPVVRRGAVAAGICVPVLMVLILAAIRRADTTAAVFRQRLAMWVAPIFLLASICTHALEMYTLLCFAGAAGLVVLVGLDATGDKRQVLKLAGLFAVVVGLYLPVHRLALPELTTYERELKTQLSAEFNETYPDLRTMLVGPMGQEAGDLLGGHIPATTAGVIGIPALALAAFAAPAGAAMLALAIVPLALMFASPAGYLALALATSADSVQEATAYFGLLGLLALSIGIAAAAQAVMALATRPRSILRRATAVVFLIAVAFSLWSGGLARTAKQILDFARSQPRLFLLLAAVLGVAVLFIAARRRSHPFSERRFEGAAVFLAAVIAIPLAGLGLPPAERVDLVARVRSASAAPSVLDWNDYYDVLRETILPRMPVPRLVVDDLRRLLPARQVLLAHPGYSCSLAALLDAYCVNPEFIYGQYYLTAHRYQNAYVYSIDADTDWHPFFNDTWPMEDRERTFLQEYSVDYLLADPAHARLIARKLGALNIPVIIQSSRDGYVLYRLDG